MQSIEEQREDLDKATKQLELKSAACTEQQAELTRSNQTLDVDRQAFAQLQQENKSRMEQLTLAQQQLDAGRAAVIQEATEMAIADANHKRQLQAIEHERVEMEAVKAQVSKDRVTLEQLLQEATAAAERAKAEHVRCVVKEMAALQEERAEMETQKVAFEQQQQQGTAVIQSLRVEVEQLRRGVEVERNALVRGRKALEEQEEQSQRVQTEHTAILDKAVIALQREKEEIEDAKQEIEQAQAELQVERAQVEQVMREVVKQQSNAAVDKRQMEMDQTMLDQLEEMPDSHHEIFLHTTDPLHATDEAEQLQGNTFILDSRQPAPEPAVLNAQADRLDQENSVETFRQIELEQAQLKKERMDLEHHVHRMQLEMHMQAQNVQEALQAERASAKQHDSERKVLESDRIALSKEFMHEQELLRRERALLHEVEQRLRMVQSGGVDRAQQKFGLTGAAAGDPTVSGSDGRFGTRS